MSSRYDPTSLSLCVCEVAAIKNLLNSGGNLQSHVEHLRWQMGQYDKHGLYAHAETELTDLTSAIEKIQSTKSY